MHPGLLSAMQLSLHHLRSTGRLIGWLLLAASFRTGGSVRALNRGSLKKSGRARGRGQKTVTRFHLLRRMYPFSMRQLQQNVIIVKVLFKEIAE